MLILHLTKVVSCVNLSINFKLDNNKGITTCFLLDYKIHAILIFISDLSYLSMYSHVQIVFAIAMVRTCVPLNNRMHRLRYLLSYNLNYDY